jgi:NAD(P)-dependent dehydrogenase (short-subunit alcohol dehydrogenase family)
MAKAKEARDRVALITGAASGIGLATVERLLEAGWKVAALDRDEGALASLAGKVGKPQRLFTSTLDVTNEAAAEKAIAMAGEALGRIDGVLNSAGIAADIPALDTPVELFRKILDVNVVGTFIVARAAARLMRSTGGGAIVNISSISGLRGSKGRSAYGASKGAVVVLTQVLANDLARYGIRVNAVAPGTLDAAYSAAPLRQARRDRQRHRVPARRHEVELHDRRDRRRRRRLPRHRYHGRLRTTPFASIASVRTAGQSRPAHKPRRAGDPSGYSGRSSLRCLMRAASIRRFTLVGVCPDGGARVSIFLAPPKLTNALATATSTRPHRII